MAGASARVTGGGNESLIEYTPPATGDGGQDRIRYRLRATGNRGSALATLRITVTATGPQTNTYGAYTDPPKIMALRYSADGYFPGSLGAFSISVDNTTPLVFVEDTEPGPWPGDWPPIVSCSALEFDAMWDAFANSGPPQPGFPGAYLNPGGVFTVTTAETADPTVRSLSSWSVTPP